MDTRDAFREALVAPVSPLRSMEQEAEDSFQLGEMSPKLHTNGKVGWSGSSSRKKKNGRVGKVEVGGDKRILDDDPIL